MEESVQITILKRIQQVLAECNTVYNKQIKDKSAKNDLKQIKQCSFTLENISSDIQKMPTTELGFSKEFLEAKAKFEQVATSNVKTMNQTSSQNALSLLFDKILITENDYQQNNNEEKASKRVNKIDNTLDTTDEIMADSRDELDRVLDSYRHIYLNKELHNVKDTLRNDYTRVFLNDNTRGRLTQIYNQIADARSEMQQLESIKPPTFNDKALMAEINSISNSLANKQTVEPSQIKKLESYSTVISKHMKDEKAFKLDLEKKQQALTKRLKDLTEQFETRFQLIIQTETNARMERLIKQVKQLAYLAPNMPENVVIECSEFIKEQIKEIEYNVIHLYSVDHRALAMPMLDELKISNSNFINEYNDSKDRILIFDRK